MKVYVVFGKEDWDSAEEMVRLFASAESAQKFVDEFEDRWEELLINERELHP